MRHTVTIQTVATTQDEAGALLETWADFMANVPCEVFTVSGGERFRGGQVDATANHTIWTRKVAGVTPQMRVKYGTKTLNIIAVRDDRQNLDTHMYVDCKESV